MTDRPAGAIGHLRSLPRRVDPRYTPKARASTAIGSGAAVLTVTALLVPTEAAQAVVAAAAVFFVVTVLCWLVLARAEAHDTETRALWSLGALVSDGRVWPAPGGWALGADAALLLLMELELRGLRTVVELGPGASSIILGRGGQGDLELFGLEHDSRFAAAVRLQLEQHGVENYTLFEAPLLSHEVDGRTTLWYDPAVVEKLPHAIDVLIVDGPPATNGRLARAPAWPLLRGRMRSGALVLVDDTGRTDERRMVNHWLAGGGLSVLRDAGGFVLLEVE